MSVTTESKKKTATEKKAYDPEEIKVRRVNFKFNADNPRFYYKNNPFSTHFINALHIVFPTGERFFVNSVLKHQQEINDEKLKKQVPNTTACVKAIPSAKLPTETALACVNCAL